MARVQHHQAHAEQDAVVDTLHDHVVDKLVGNVAPPRQDIGLGKHAITQSVLRLIERGRTHARTLTEVHSDSLGDGRVHALGINGAYRLVALLVQVLTPDGDTRSGSFVVHDGRPPCS